MRKRILSALVAIGMVIGIGGYTLTQATAAPVATASVSHSGNITCAKNNSRELTVFDQTCPAGFFYVQIPAEDIAGAVVGQPVKAPAPVVVPGVIVPVHKITRLNNLSPATQTITLTGLPGYRSSGVDLLDGNTAGECPAGVSVNVTKLTPSTGSTQRQFTVSVAGFSSTEVCDLDVYQLSLAP